VRHARIQPLRQARKITGCLAHLGRVEMIDNNSRSFACDAAAVHYECALCALGLAANDAASATSWSGTGRRAARRTSRGP
jgi:hypothetical protein